MATIIKLIVLLLMILACFGRKHKIDISHDVRKYISLSTFGFYKGGFLEVNLMNFTMQYMQKSDVFGFSLYRTENNIINPYLNEYHENCFLNEDLSNEYDTAVMYFIFNFYNNMITISCSPGWKQFVHVYDQMPSSFSKSNLHDIGGTVPLNCARSLPLHSETINNGTYYNASFVIYISSYSEEGLYNLYFHSCPNYVPNIDLVYNFKMEIIEQNAGSYLSAGEMPLPLSYCILAVLFFLTSCFWVFVLMRSKYPIFKIHYLMATLILLKSITLLFQGINYRYIEHEGDPLVTWAVLYYVANFSTGLVFVTTITLISAGWTIIKRRLLPREKLALAAILLLQIVSNVSAVRLELLETSAPEHGTWRTIFVLGNLLCSGLILVPIVWSMRKLKKAPATMVNLRKVKLFRYFFVMLVCYVYFSIIIVYLLAVTVPFKYDWLKQMFQETTAYVFFVLTGYKFRPEILSESGSMQMFTCANTGIGTKQGAFIAEVTEEEKDALLFEKENNPEYD